MRPVVVAGGDLPAPAAVDDRAKSSWDIELRRVAVDGSGTFAYAP
jgi:hypothetical protein